MEWTKIIYETIGPRFPVASLIAVALFGAFMFGGGWWLLGKQYLREHPQKQPSIELNATHPIPADNVSAHVEPESQKQPEHAPTAKRSEPHSTPMVPTKEKDKMSDTPKINQTMMNSPGGLQVGRDLNVNVNAARRLAEAQKQFLIGEMSKSVGTNGSGLITCIMGDPESTTLALDFVDVFRRAGWALPGSGFNQALFSGLPRGVIVKIHSREDTELPQIKRLIESMFRLGLQRSGEIDPNVPSGEFQLIIGARPD
jgi:hypothetical protein